LNVFNLDDDNGLSRNFNLLLDNFNLDLNLNLFDLLHLGLIVSLLLDLLLLCNKLAGDCLMLRLSVQGELSPGGDKISGSFKLGE
jgi:hypothetical protein